MIAKYFKRIQNSLDNYSHIIEDYILNKQTFTSEKGAIDGEVFFNNNSQLGFNEIINTNKTQKQKYSYHYMDENKELIFRYDNVKHHRKIKTFPHHKHTTNGIVESSESNSG